jgi:hypothetical protein
VAWVGSTQDCLPLAATGWAAGRHAWWVEAGMIATTTRLVVGGWCKLVTASGGALAVAIVEAVLVELPLSALSLYIAAHAPVVTAQGLTTARAGV